MKQLTKILLLTVLIIGFSSIVHAQNHPGRTITYQEFYDRLSPYGTWIDYPTYGHVWHPKVDKDFRPYASNGNWEYTDQGWLWDSDFDWGWAPFHYGRWFLDDAY